MAKAQTKAQRMFRQGKTLKEFLEAATRSVVVGKINFLTLSDGSMVGINWREGTIFVHDVIEHY